MEFEEMQIIWNRQNDEKYYAINEDQLYARIRARSRSVERILALFELGMIAVNLVVAITLLVDALGGSEQIFRFVLPAAYFGYSVFALVRRAARRKAEVHYEATMIGELDQAIWRIDYLIRQSRSIFYWYVLPLVLAGSFFFIANGKLVWALAMLLVLLPAAYLGTRWETSLYLPKKKALESLREMLLAPQPEGKA